MKPGCVLINVGRGPIIHEADLVKALKKGWIAGPALMSLIQNHCRPIALFGRWTTSSLARTLAALPGSMMNARPISLPRICVAIWQAILS